MGRVRQTRPFLSAPVSIPGARVRKPLAISTSLSRIEGVPRSVRVSAPARPAFGRAGYPRSGWRGVRAGLRTTGWPCACRSLLPCGERVSDEWKIAGPAEPRDDGLKGEKQDGDERTQ